MKIIKLFLLSFLLFFLASCSSDDDTPQKDGIKDTISEVAIPIPSDVSKLFVGKGDATADTVMIFEQGGPDFELAADIFEEEDEDAEDEFPTDFKKYFKDYYRVYIHQALTLNDNLCASEKPTKVTSYRTIKTSVEILDRVIKNFKSKGKKVYVVGHSWGGFVISKYIAGRGNTSADKFLIMAARLDMQLVVAENFSNFIPYYFKDGQLPTKEDRKGEIEEDIECPIVYTMIGVMGSERFTQTITVNDLSNVIYVYANDDEQTGDLLPNEEDFLAKKT